MSKILAAFRKFFAGKTHHEEGNSNGQHEERKPNEFQKADRKLHPYDEVKLDNEGHAVTPEGQTQNHPESATKRAPRSYDEVDLPIADGKVHVHDGT